MYIRCTPGQREETITTAQLINTTTYKLLQTTLISLHTFNSSFKHSTTTTTTSKMATSHIETPIGNVDAAVVIAALHNHDLMIKTVCPALVSYSFESGDKTSAATYLVTDKKPIGQVCPSPFRLPSFHILNLHRQPTNSPSPTSPTASIPSSTQSPPSAS